VTITRWSVLGVALLAAVIFALGLGAVSIAPGDVFAALFGGGDVMASSIVRDVRLPRVMLALFAGSALAMSGATLQGVLRNPLAEPYLLGVSGGAAVGAVLAVTAGLDGAIGVSAAAFADRATRGRPLRPASSRDGRCRGRGLRQRRDHGRAECRLTHGGAGRAVVDDGIAG
jgi:ABC-type Fe3+-siderophore transport system permease subunit